MLTAGIFRKNCCYDCKERTPTCHLECKGYKEFTKQRQEANAKRRLAKMGDKCKKGDR